MQRSLLLLMLLASLVLSGCGSSFEDGPSGQPGGDSAVIPTPPVGTATIVVNHVLARAVPSTIDSFRFSGTNAAGQVVFGPDTRARASTITITNVPVTVATLRIEYLEDGQVVGRFSTAVQLTAGGTVTISDPAWVDVDDVATATRLGILSAPTTAAPGVALAPPLRVSVLDADGNPVTTSSAAVTVRVSSGPGTLGGTLTVNAVNGVATFSDLTLSAPGSYQLQATASGLTSATSATVVVSQQPMASALTFSTQPTDSTGRLTSIQVAVLDQFGQSFTDYSGPVTLALGSNPSGASLTGALTVSAVNGVATFENILVTLAGADYTLTASAQGLTPATSQPFDVSRGQLNRSLFSLVQPLVYRDTASPSLEVGDFNNDGLQDAMMASLDEQSVFILEQTPAGDVAARTLSVPNLVLVRTGDVNGDGRPDMVALTESSQGYGLELRLASGDGFAAPTSTLLGQSIASVADFKVADLDGDGNADLVLSCQSGEQGPAAFFVATSTGSNFEPIGITELTDAQTITCGPVAVGNFDGDDNIDIAVAAGNQVQLFGNSGLGGFENFHILESSASAPIVALLAADFDLDNLDDIVLGDNAGNLQIFLNENGAFTVPVGGTTQQSNSNLTLGALAAGDFNGDGTLDIISSCQTIYLTQGLTADALLYLLDFDGTGVFPDEPVAINVGNRPGPVAATDLNNDGHLDLVLANLGGSLLRLNGDGQGNLLPLADQGSERLSAAVGDLDGDGRTDLAVGGQNLIRIYLRDENGAIPSEPSSTVPAVGAVTALALGAVEQGGSLDLFAASGDTVEVFSNEGQGTFDPASPQLVSFGQNISKMEVADLNGDGLLDIVTSPTQFGALQVALGQGPGYTLLEPITTTGYCQDVALADIDGDGTINIVTAELESGVGVYQYADGAFSGSTTSLEGERAVGVACGDLDSDGSPDVAVTTLSGTAFGQLLVLTNDGEGGLSRSVTLTSPGLSSPLAVQVQDADGNGTNDILVLDTVAYGCAVYSGSGDGVNFSSGSMIFAGGEPAGRDSLVLLDLDGDGVLEPLFARYTSAGGTLVSLLTLLGLVAAGALSRRGRVA